VKFAVGYQLPDEDQPPFVALAREFREHLAEVYFPWPEMASGRSPLGRQRGYVDWTAQARLEQDLAELRGLGLKLDLLLNASCYGRHAYSQELVERVSSIVGHLVDTVGLDIVTTMSPLLAETMKREFPEIEVRASINMRLGAIASLEYVAHLFDSFYLQREYNRDLAHIGAVQTWAQERGKRLLLLANSGCLSFCSVQTFHDNLVAHEAEVAGMVNVPAESPALCWSFYQDPAHWVYFLRGTWIRPEDVPHYEGLVSVMKLATRMHANPRRVVQAYVSGSFRGNLPDLLEPGHGPCFAPRAIDNARFPADWFERTTTCGRRCAECGYCEAVLAQVLE